jgi:hypothetical protein
MKPARIEVLTPAGDALGEDIDHESDIDETLPRRDMAKSLTHNWFGY